MIEQAVRIVRIMLGNVTTVTWEQIEECVNQVAKMPDYSEIDKDKLIREIDSIYIVRQEDYRIIEIAERRTRWLDANRSSINWKFWLRYRDYLQDVKNYPPETIKKLNELTDEILDCQFDPKDNIQISKKGLVVGHVQSGKTSNYTGLICKAADSGYKFIIILAGIHNNLRSQTQLRIDEGFLGFDTQHARSFKQDNIKIGVGQISPEGVAHSLTSSLDNGDFNQSTANSSAFNFDTTEPIIAVVKKNPNVLRRLYQWLSAQGVQEESGQRKIRNKSLLIIDDEADNASINISNDPEQRSTINRLITQIIDLFSKNGYIGYTATPFANIFIPIEEDNLFPRDFIINIEPPSNYIGPSKVFGSQFPIDEEDTLDLLPIINRVDDYSPYFPDKHKQYDQLPSSIPDSLKKAIRCFILTSAIRRLRGQTTVHNSMLIHVSRFQRWQDHVAELVENQLDYYRMSIDQNDTEILSEFRKTFEEDSVNYKSYVKVTDHIINSSLCKIDPNISCHLWEEILPHLNEAVTRIKVRAIHGNSGEVLDYYDRQKNGLSVIAIGGNKLSRGLTLEGLSISYFLRSSRMYDTLMQMGRWFGYHKGYVDLCRLFISPELNEWFCQITHASEELREEFDYMRKQAGATPEQYALKVRTFPGTLLVSSLTKLKQAIYFDLSYSSRLVQTTVLYTKHQEVHHNYQILNNFINQLDHPVESDHAIFTNVTPNEIIDLFISQFKFHPNLRTINVPLIKKYIDDCNRNGELLNWTVAVFSSQDKGAISFPLNINDKIKYIGLTKRSAEESTNPISDNLYQINKSQVISPKHEFVDVADLSGKPTGRQIRNARNPINGLLMIYLLDPKNIEADYETPIVALAFSFPNSPSNVSVRYAAHNQLLEYLDWEETEEGYNEED